MFNYVYFNGCLLVFWSRSGYFWCDICLESLNDNFFRLIWIKWLKLISFFVILNFCSLGKKLDNRGIKKDFGCV